MKEVLHFIVMNKRWKPNYFDYMSEV